MKKTLILGLLLVVMLGVVQAAPYRTDEIPNVQLLDSRRYVSNPDGILSAPTVARLDTLCESLRRRGYAQVAVVAVDDIAMDDTFDFAIELFRSWGVGGSESNNGLGVLLVKNRREIRFVTGYGLEGTLPDALCRRIQETYMLPSFREGDYDRGMWLGLEATAWVLEGGEVDPSRGDRPYFTWWESLLLFAVIFVVFPVGIRLISRYARTRCPHCGKRTLKEVSSTNVAVTSGYRIEECEFLCTHCGERTRRQFRHDRDDHFGGSGGGTFIGGGSFRGGSFRGGSFGGGSFGGGGGGSRW